MLKRIRLWFIMWRVQWARRLRWGRCCDCPIPTADCCDRLLTTGRALSDCPTRLKMGGPDRRLRRPAGGGGER